MEEILEELKQDQHASSTKATYYRVWRKFNQFIIKLDDIPKLWEHRTKLYCAYITHEKGLQSATVKSYVSAIKSILANDGYHWDENLLILSALTNSCKRKNDKLKMRLPIRKGLLETILGRIQRKYAKLNQPYLELLYMVSFLLAYYGMMRAGEITESEHSIRAANVHKSNSKNKLLLILYSSKTHNRADLPQKIKIEGQQYLHVTNQEHSTTFHTTSRTYSNYCPATWTKYYLAARGPYLHPNEQLLIFSDGSPLTAYHLRHELRDTLRDLKLNPKNYDIHSFRIGRATDLYKWGISIDKIKELGRWKSNAVYKYLRY